MIIHKSKYKQGKLSEKKKRALYDKLKGFWVYSRNDWFWSHSLHNVYYKRPTYSEFLQIYNIPEYNKTRSKV